MPNWRRLGSVLTICVMLLLPLPASARSLPADHGGIAVRPELSDEAVRSRSFIGVVEWEDLEGGFYAVEGYRLIADPDLLKSLHGHLVTVRGALSTEPSFYMVPAIEVEHIERVAPGSLVRFSGELVYEELEGGFYAIKGYRLTGDKVDPDQLKELVGRQVLVTGTIIEEISIYMTKAFAVESLVELGNASDLPLVEEDLLLELRLVEARRSLPQRVLVDDNAVEFRRMPLLRNDILMLPLRATVEAVRGGKVEWLAESRTVVVAMPGRTAQFVIDENEAELNEDGICYFRRNMLPLAHPTELIDGVAFVSADALSTILGFMARPAADDVLDILSPAAWKELLEVELPEENGQTVVGSIKEIDDGEYRRFLLEGGPMSSGEPFLAWLTIGEDTEIQQANGEAAQFADLTVGQVVSAYVPGPLLMSYPAQGGAERIVIVSESAFGTVAGSINDITTEGRVRILVDGIDAAGYPMPIWLAIDVETAISWQSGEAATAADLAVGQVVEAELSGPVMESYPYQGNASKVTIMK
ncbi:MAG: stalk domain-containing protein [Bacillota bacterium]